ncbi:hypothetical protein [Maribellus maritimus]|uniref:hypothetical protein n=1 Tax=Maribellus maritimus TaxID=2870838 RepID=UPI001EEAA15B|nr:hypothetical protein [Maribellus maritimus]MCG6187398.1 hypothetical protein [Maribellus maritimus]
MKRNLILFLIFVVALVAGFIYFTKDEVTFIKETSVYKAVPVTTPGFFEFRSLKSIPVDNPIIKEMKDSNIGNSFLGLITQMDSLVKDNNDVQSGLRNESFILAFNFSGKTDLIPLFIKNANTNNKKTSVKNLIELLYPVSQYRYEESNYSGNKITAVSKENSSVLFFCFSEGIFLASPKATMVEQAIRQMNTYTILNDRFFTEVNKTVTLQSDVSLYINHVNFPELVGNWMNRKSTQSVNEFGETVRLNYKNRTESFGDFASWTELDVEFDDDKILFNGVSVADDSLNHFLSVFDGQDAVNSKADEVLPKNTSFFVSYSFSDKNIFFENLERYFSHTDSYYKREEQIKKIETGLRTDFKESLKGIVNDEVIVAATTIPVDPSHMTTFFILHTEGRTLAVEQLTSWLSSYAARKGAELSSLSKIYSVDRETKFTIYEFPYPSFPGIWLGKPFAAAKANFVAFHDNYMVFSNSEKGLEEYLHNMVLDASLDHEVRYLKFKQNIANRSNVNTYIDVNRAYSFSKQLFNPEITREVEEKEEALRKIQAVNWQIIHDKELFFNSMVLAFNPKAQEEAQTTWQSNIGNSIQFKPQIVVNHDNPANREVILQDEQNNLYQITNEGRVRWTISVAEPVIGEIFQVDYYKNGKLQYLFNTKNRLYLIDRNGNNVAHFPVVFSSPATAGVNVFDYDNNRNYRYFIPHENKKVVAYDYTGKVVSGWIFKQTDHLVTTPIQHFRVGRRDFIVFKDKSRIYILDRRGNSRVNTSATFENSRNPLILNLDGIPKIVATDVTGKVYYIFFDGKYSEKKIGKFGADHFFTCDDLNGNGVPDFVFIDGNELKVMDENGKKLYAEKFDNLIKDPPNIYIFGPKMKKVGVVDESSNRIYLYNPEGHLHDGFPLQGSSQFSIGKMSEATGSLSLLVGSDGGNLFNYTLN